ncbi:AraC family transcriptional regulator [Pseudonocardia sp. MCCB 268]|nr:AraC family transcriptional regulator [Pseudonocardia cytotoxica]
MRELVRASGGTSTSRRPPGCAWRSAWSGCVPSCARGPTRPGAPSPRVAAADWGFHHLGRFAVAHRRRWGESPSATPGDKRTPAAWNGWPPARPVPDPSPHARPTRRSPCPCCLALLDAIGPARSGSST